MSFFHPLIPLVCCALGAAIAAAHGLTPINRLVPTRIYGWVVAAFPMAAFISLVGMADQLFQGQMKAIVFQQPWIPGLATDEGSGISFSIYLDGLSILFALLITGIGVLVTVYTGYYFSGTKTAWRFATYMCLFMVSMLGVVVAGDLILLFVFWEATSITSFLLIGYKGESEAARRGAFKSLFITGGGGIALLVGLLMISMITGTFSLGEVLTQGDVIQASPLYPWLLALVVLGCITKSAQVPFHTWLPDGMTAPTPASAYLHSATMVKAGIYLLARLHPSLGDSDLWFWSLTSIGAVTMVTGAWLGVRQTDLKALLAYSTVSQLGALVMLIGQKADIAFKALAVGILAHALYKSALFMLAGIVDHETGTRDLRKLGGLRAKMPRTAIVAMVAGLSMAGLPPMFGFLAKETMLAMVAHPSLPDVLVFLLSSAAVVAGALIFCQAAILVLGTFFGSSRDQETFDHAHDAPWGMLLAPLLPALLSLLIIIPVSTWPVELLGAAAQSVYGEKVKIDLSLWHGLNTALLLSIIAVSIGTTLFLARRRFIALQHRLDPGPVCNALYRGSILGIDGSSWLVTRVQNGYLRMYLLIMFVGLGIMVLVAGLPPLPTRLPPLRLDDGWVLVRVVAIALATAAAVSTVLLKRDLYAILALGASGLAVAVLFLLIPAPDVALVMIVVDILMLVILVLALVRFPKPQREGADELDYQETWLGKWRDGLVSAGVGLATALAMLFVLVTRPDPAGLGEIAWERESRVTDFFFAAAKPLTGAADVVGAILIDFRATDTYLEIMVFALAGAGVYTLLRFASPAAGDDATDAAPADLQANRGPGASFWPVAESPLTRLLALLILPLSLMLALAHVLFGHDQPGDGFTAGVVASLAVAFWYIILGYEGVHRTLPWLRPMNFVGGGLSLGIVVAIMGAIFNQNAFSPVNFALMLGITTPYGISLSTGLMFEVAIFLAVLGGATLVIDTLGHPRDRDTESDRQATLLPVLEARGDVTSPLEDEDEDDSHAASVARED
ncbi:MAG: DUF4040 domain-containing protein [Phycisphaeraceae bacterium]|nr:DUF4040 domain-containing protein [Phycisphaeraceae bacterium]